MEPFLDVNSFTSLTLEDDTPLATLKLTYLTKSGQTVIGLSFNQSIGKRSLLFKIVVFLELSFPRGWSNCELLYPRYLTVLPGPGTFE
jgi:hypothetical protein